jgi:type IV secretion system protein VirD4
MNLNKEQAIFLTIIDLILVYFFTGVILLLLNNYGVKGIIPNYSLNLTLDAILNGYPKIVESLLIALLICTLFVFIIPFLPKKEELHGSARFANMQEVKNKMKLFAEKGIIVGKKGNKLLRLPGQQFVALAAPTGTGKGVSIVIPNLLDWTQSCVVLDIKQENFSITSKYRQSVLKQDVYLVNPFSFETHKYNPLTYIDMEDNEKRDLQLMDLANILYPFGGTENDKFFNQNAQNLLIGICYMYRDLTSSQEGLALLQDINFTPNFTLYGLLDMSQNMEIKLDESSDTIKGFDKIIEFLNSYEYLSQETNNRFNSYLNIESKNTKSGVWSSFITPLLFFQNEVTKKATSQSDFDLRDLRKKRMTIYIGITPDELAKAQLFLNILWSQIISLNTKELPEQNKALKYECLLMMDEFTAIGYMPILQKSVSYIRGYALRLVTIFQNISQIQDARPTGYGKEGAKTLLANHGCKVYFAQEENEDAEMVSKLLGYKTIKQTSRSFNHGGKSGGSNSRNVSETKRALMLPQELKELDNKKEIITVLGNKPLICEKAFYYNDPYFMDKLKKVSPTLKRIKKLPTKEELSKAIQRNEMSIKIKKV